MVCTLQSKSMAREKSIWQDAELPTFPPLKGALDADVAIIGGGITGLLTAYVLSSEGKRVAVLEKDRLASGASGLTTAFITQSIDTDVTDQIAMWGEDGARLIWQSHRDAMALIERIIKTENIECDFVRCPAYVYATTSKEARFVEEEYRDMKKLGFPVVLGSRAKLPFKHRQVMVIKNQAKFHPRAFLKGVVEVLLTRGVMLYEKSGVEEIRGERPFEVILKDGLVRASWTITATYHPFNNPKEVLLKKGMYKTYVVAFDVPAGKYPEGIYEDMENPYHYFRVDAGKGARGKDQLILGGEDHRVEIPLHAKNFEALLEYSEELFGKRYPITHRWTGPIEEPIDGLALIGEYDPGKIVATAFSGNGMTYGALSALIVRDIIQDAANPYRALYAPGRMPTLTQLWKKGRDYGEEFFKGAIVNALKQ